MNKEEILKLHELSEEKQRQVLIFEGVLKGEKIDQYNTAYESLADCAFRLRDEFVEVNGMDLWKGQIKKLLDADIYEWRTWTARAKPIHWIQAALLAQIEKERKT